VQHICTHPTSSTARVCTWTSLYYNLRITSELLGFSLHHTLISSATFNHILFCLSLSNLIHNQSQHIQSLQQLTHASQPYNMNATQSCIRNRYTIEIISVLNHKSVAHSINQHKPHHKSHTKNALSIHYTTRKSIHQENFYGRSEPVECISRTCFSIQEPTINSTTSLHEFIQCMCPILL
jgi:hypothetical protein